LYEADVNAGRRVVQQRDVLDRARRLADDEFDPLLGQDRSAKAK
jgi:hypothetical protein